MQDINDRGRTDRVVLRETQFKKPLKITGITYLSADGGVVTVPLRTIFSWHNRGDDQSHMDDPQYRRYLQLTDDACAQICLSPTFNAALQRAPAVAKMAVSFAPLDKDTMGLYHRRDEKKAPHIQLAARLADAPKAAAVLPWLIAHEGGHGVQDETGINIDGHVTVEDIILHSRIHEADSCALQTSSAWDLRTLGHDAPWRDLLSQKKYGPIAAAFAALAARDPESVPSGAAANAAFLAWFDSRVLRDRYDRNACTHVITQTRRQIKDWQGTSEREKIAVRPTAIDDDGWRRILRSHARMPFLDAAEQLVERPLYLDDATINAVLSPRSRAVTNRRAVRHAHAALYDLETHAYTVRDGAPVLRPAAR